MTDRSLHALKRIPPRSKQKTSVKCSKRGLELLLLTLTLLSSLTGTASNSVQNPSQKRLNRILGGSVLLPADIPSAENVSRIEWDFQGGNDLKFVLAEFWDGKAKRVNPKDRFGQRLEITNETTLRIKDLEIMDSGRYAIRVRFASARYQDETLDIAVYEPVPEPKILPQYLSNSPDGCNVTLQCLVPGKGGFNISWQRGDPLRDLEDGSDWYHLSGNGTDLHVFWQLNFPEPKFTCLVTNPADQKSISFNFLHVCQTEKQQEGHTSATVQPTSGDYERVGFLSMENSSFGNERSSLTMEGFRSCKHEHGQQWWWILLIPLFVILVLLTAFGIQTWKKRKKKPPNRDASTMPKEETAPELQYTEVIKRSPPEGDDDQEDARLSDATVSSPSPYALLQLPTHRSEQVT